jgi:molybdenum cofactor cytidylyltransferase
MTRSDRDLPVVGLILAAGLSTRMRGMGCPKQLLPLAGRPMLQHVLDAALASRLDEVVLVLGCGADEIRRALVLPEGAASRTVVVSDFARGQSVALRAGVQACGSQVGAVAVLLGDQPRVGAERIDRVVGAFLDSPLPLARPVFRGNGGEEIPGHPVLIARELWPEMEALHGDVGLRAILPRLSEQMLEISMEGPPPLDVDTPEAYRRLVDATQALG